MAATVLGSGNTNPILKKLTFWVKEVTENIVMCTISSMVSVIKKISRIS